MKKFFKKLKKFVLGGDGYGFLWEKDLPQGSFREVYLPGIKDLDFVVTSDNNDIAKNHCGATAATNLGLYLMPQEDRKELFKAMHKKIGNGPVTFISGKIKRVFRSFGRGLEFSRTRDLEKIKAAVDRGQMLILLLADGIFDWHFVQAVGYRIYDDGQEYLILMDNWNRRTFRYYKLNSGSLLLGATSYSLEP